jgi:GNAT superfamily N-acetyltransferase
MSTAPPGSPQQPPTVPGTPRPAHARDLPRIVAAADAIFRTPVPAGLGSMGHDYPLLFAPDNANNLLIIEDAAGEPLAHAGFVLRDASLEGIRVRVATIGAVFTRAEQRQMGLAGRVLAAAVTRAREAGAELGLVSGQRGLYQRAGFTPYPACPRYRVKATDRAAVPAGSQIVPYHPDARGAVMELYARERVHFVRSAADWEAMLGAGVVFFEPARTFLIQRAGVTVAYLVAGCPPQPSSGDGAPGDSRGARVLELAGDRSAIASAMPAVAQILGRDAVDLVLPPGDRSLAPLAQHHGWQIGEVQMPFTTAWWNPALREKPLPFYGFNYV